MGQGLKDGSGKVALVKLLLKSCDLRKEVRKGLSECREEAGRDGCMRRNER